MMNERRRKNTLRRGRSRLVRTFVMGLAVVAIVAAWWTWLHPASLRYNLDATCRVDVRSRYVVALAGGDSLVLSTADGRLTDASGRPTGGHDVRLTGCFVSASGHVVTTTAAFNHAPDSLAGDTLRRLLESERRRLTQLAATKAEAVKELDYYARTHTVTDDGYNEVMACRSRYERRRHDVDSLLRMVDSALLRRDLSARLEWDVRLTSVVPTAYDADGRTPTAIATHAVAARIVARRDSLLLLQTADATLPPRATYFSLFDRRTVPGDGLLLTGPVGRDAPDVVPAACARLLPLRYTEGAAVVDARGRLAAIHASGRNITAAAVARLCFDAVGRAALWGDNALAMLRRAFLPSSVSDTAGVRPVRLAPRNIAGRHSAGTAYATLTLPGGTYSGRASGGRPEGFGSMVYANRSHYTGMWHNGRREGRGECVDSAGRRYEGRWAADTLASGTATDSAGIYIGEFDRQLRHHGEGRLYGADGTLYSGGWEHGRREGFGFAIGERKMVRAGMWKADAFRGEQMIYTADRIYGIDISRYQHEIGRKRYGIDWKQLRITSLGTPAAARIRGRQDYPVSFVYIKASQGTAIRNRYYAADVAACRREGISVGAYHFFSTKTDGKDQAVYFIKQARPRVGDLPPMLDVEPTDAQITAMGGSATMFREMLAWLRHVEAACGTAPVLYVSQSFVNKYMSHAPSALGRYQVWIARYGEYKPYVHLLYWQLSPNGRVAGIQGAVDINVYNGSREDFREYVATHGVKRAAGR